MVLGFWGSGSYAWFIELDASGTPKFNAYMYGPALRIGSTSTLALNTWYHIVFTTSSTGGKKLYLNGVLEGNNADTQDATTKTWLVNKPPHHFSFSSMSIRMSFL